MEKSILEQIEEYYQQIDILQYKIQNLIKELIKNSNQPLEKKWIKS